ncbi:hypothetical protein HGRIS_006104 [Hohenbuehelia grisea]|uniref:Uncharacterized protein n=1 Tax=Hohenbuehelia grisea TaxID=104357 RepID=A0ABR3JYT7_9AGAR
MAACLRFTRRVWKSFIDTKGHDAKCFPNLHVQRATPGVVEASLKIEQYNLNRVGVSGRELSPETTTYIYDRPFTEA